MTPHDSAFLAEQLALYAGYKPEASTAAAGTDDTSAGWREPHTPLPPDAAAQLEKARQCVRVGDLFGARLAAERAANWAPQAPQTRALFGAVLLEDGDFATAREHLDAAAALAPTWAEAARLSGEAAAALGDIRAAVVHFQRALTLRPNWPTAARRLGELHIKSGDFIEGFRLIEARFADQSPLSPIAQWDGQTPLWDKSILIVPEREIGDLVQFIRYADLLKKRGATVFVLCPPDLKPLVESVPGVAKALSAGEPMPPLDFMIPLLSLPRVFETMLGTVPADVPYISTDERFVAAWRTHFASLAPDARLRIGLVWADAGEPSTVPTRSVRLSDLSALWDVPDVAWFALQQGPPQEELEHNLTPLIDVSHELAGADAVVAAVGALDLLIAVDTPATHVKAALGQPTWAMLSASCDWRWLGRGETTPWYPSVRIFRQDPPGEWQPVARRVARELIELLRQG